MAATMLLSWATFVVHVLLALGFGILCLVYMRRLGTGGALLLAGVAVLDVLVSVAYRVFSLALPTIGYQAVEAGYTLLDIGSAGVSVLSAVMVLAALVLLRRAPEPE
jgi:hypothetical protein